MKFLVSLTNGVIENPTKLQEFLKSRKNGLYTISVKKHGTRSLAQNSYYWWVFNFSLNVLKALDLKSSLKATDFNVKAKSKAL